MTTNSTQNGGLSRTLGRLLKAGALGLALFAFGTLVFQSGIWNTVYSKVSGIPDTDQKGLEDQALANRTAMLAAREAWLKDVQSEPPPVPVSADGFYAPPAESAIPDTPFGESIRRGRDIFVNTGEHAPQFVGNSQSCANCHLDGGRKEHSAPLWGAYPKYPAFRGKNQKVNTFQERIKGCFTYSMNAQASPSGEPPPLGSDVYVDLESYAFWLSDGVPTGAKIPGAGYPKLAKTELGYDYERGEEVFVANCALCHGDDGQGRREADSSLRFPPLWGPEAYNWGAGMSRINTAAAFIKANMPLSKPTSLTDQEAWDVAAYISSFERPKDPRQTGTVEENRARHHDGDDIYYGQEVRGKILGIGVSREQPSSAIAQ